MSAGPAARGGSRAAAAALLRWLWSGAALAAVLTLGTPLAGEAPPTVEEVRALITEGRYSEAERRGRALLELAEAGSGADSPQTGDALEVLLESLIRSGKTQEPGIRALAERGVVIRERALDPQDPRLAKSLNILAIVHQDAGDLAGARALFERALAIREKALGPDHPDVAASLSSLGTLLRDIGEYAAAKDRYERALRIREEALGPDDPAVGRTRNNLAILLRITGDYAASRAQYERALAIFEKAYGPVHEDVAGVLNGLGLLAVETGDLDGARPLYERALQIRRDIFGPEHPQTAIVMKNLAWALRDKGEYTAARGLLERTLEIERAGLGERHPRLAETHWNLGRLLYGMGDFEEARGHFERMLEIWQGVAGPESGEVATSLHELGRVSVAMGRVVEGEAYYSRALELQRRLRGERHAESVSTLNGLARVRSLMGDEIEARRLLRQALEIRQATLGPDHQDVAESIEDLAESFSRSCEDREALPLFEQAVSIREKVLGPEHPEVARSLVGLARSLARQGDHAGAFRAAVRAETIAREHLRLTSRSLAEREALGYASTRASGLDLVVSLASMQREGDVESGRQALDALIRSRAIVLDEMATRHRTAGESSDPEIARVVSELRRRRTRLANLAIRGGPGTTRGEAFRPLLAEARRDVEQAERVLAERSLSFRNELAVSRVGLAEVATQLPADGALVSFVRFERSNLTAGTVQAARGAVRAGGGPCAPDQSHAVPEYLAFVLGNGGRGVALARLGNADRIDSLVGQWRTLAGLEGATIRTGQERLEGDYRRTAESLRRMIWDPLIPHLRSARRVLVVPDGALSLVAFAALPIGRSTYLVEQEPRIHYLSAERDLVTLSTPAKAGDGLLAVGAPDFDLEAAPTASGFDAGGGPPADSGSAFDARSYRGRSAECSDFRKVRFEPLPEAALEAEEVIGLWSGGGAAEGRPPSRGASRTQEDGSSVIHLTGPQATEDAFKASAPGRRILHLATHGFFLEGRCASALSTSRGVGGLSFGKEAPPAAITGENPLLLSGLVLAGANNRASADPEQEDGILTAEEISALDLTGVETAVLSACETAVGRIAPGEGVLGLRRAFQVAGVRTLVMSLWSVDDKATREWMRLYYEKRLLEGLGTQDAAHEAALALLHRRRAAKEGTHPYFWAGFVAAGDWR